MSPRKLRQPVSAASHRACEAPPIGFAQLCLQALVPTTHAAEDAAPQEAEGGCERHAQMHRHHRELDDGHGHEDRPERLEIFKRIRHVFGDRIADDGWR